MSLWDSYGVEFDSSAHEIIVGTPSDLVNYVIPKSCIRIKSGDGASKSSFYSCANSLKTLSAEEGSNLNTIDSYAFQSMKVLETVDFSNCKNLLVMNTWLFSYTESLINLKLPPLLTKIDRYAFAMCYNLTTFDLPKTVTSIEYQAFTWTKSLTKINIPYDSQLVTIYSEAFAIGALEEFFIPKGVTSFDSSTFGGLSIKITIHPENNNFYQTNDSVLTYNKSVLLYTNATGHYKVPETVTKMYQNCLRWTQIKTIEMPPNVQSYGQRWFAQSNITEIIIPPSATALPRYSFDRCVNLKSVTLSDTITTLNEYCFYMCKSLETIELANVKTIENWVFKDCIKLGDVSLPSTLKKFGQGVFSGCSSIQIDSSQNSQFYIIDGMLFSDSKTTLTEFFGTQKDIVIPAFATTIGAGVFLGKNIESVRFKPRTNSIFIGLQSFYLSTIKTIKFPETILDMSEECFSSCPNLESITIPEKSQLEKLPRESFYNCTSLTSVTLPTTIESFGENCFSCCTKLRSVNINETSVINISTIAFSETSLNEITFPQTLQNLSQFSIARCSSLLMADLSYTNIFTIPSYCFKYCSKLEIIKFPQSVTSIETEAFSYCSSLESVELPNDIQYIKSMAFYECTSLNKVVLPNDSDLQIIYGKAFGHCPNLLNLTVDADDNNFIFENGVLLNRNKTKLVMYMPSSTITTYVVPAKVQHIGPYAFEDCTNLKAVIIADGNVNSIGYSAFKGCTNLQYVNLPDSLLNGEIGQQSFDGCTKLECGSIVCSQMLQEKLTNESVFLKDYMFANSCTKPPLTQCNCNRYQRHSILAILSLISLLPSK